MKRAVGIPLILALAGALTTIVGVSTSTAAGRTLVIGVAAAHSGFLASVDGPAEAGLRLAATQFNKSGGILGRKVKFVFAGSKSDPAQSANAATEVLSKGAQYLV